MRRKVTVVGAGNVGATAAQLIAERGLADVVLADIIEGLPQGKALDLLQAGPIWGSDSLVTGTNAYEETADSDLVVITSGVARKPGMSRDDLISVNRDIVKAVTEQVIRFSPNTIMLVVTNPLDAMCYVAYKVSGLPRERVFGQSGVLDTARFRTFIAHELGVSVADVHAYVLGGHGDTMVPLIRFTTAGGVPISELLPKERIEAIVQRTRDGGAEIVNLLKTGSAFYAPGAAVAQMVEAILLDRKRILPCSVYLKGEYGIHGIYLGLPVVLGAKGIEKVIQMELTEEETVALRRSAEAVRELIAVTGL